MGTFQGLQVLSLKVRWLWASEAGSGAEAEHTETEEATGGARNQDGKHMHACMHACSICMRSPERLPSCKTEAGSSLHKICAEAAGRGLSCMSSVWSRLGLGRRDRLRSEAESSMFCARMTLSRFHKR
eukprot:356878-Chlamydomonas_euryale.AAC.4